MDDDKRLILVCPTCHGAGEVKPFRREVMQCGPCEGTGKRLCDCGRVATYAEDYAVFCDDPKCHLV